MSGLGDPRFIITLLIGSLFAYAYAQDPSDQAMKGALIAAFSAAYGFWLGSKRNEESTANTGKALDAIRKAQETPAATNGAAAASAANEVADAANDKADEIAEDTTGRERPFQ